MNLVLFTLTHMHSDLSSHLCVPLPVCGVSDAAIFSTPLGYFRLLWEYILDSFGSWERLPRVWTPVGVLRADV